MANLESIINAKAQNDANWKAQQQAERENTVAMRDSGITAVTSDPKLYGAYLQLQGDNPSYSAGNIVLCLTQLDHPTLVGTREKWRSVGRYVVDAAKGSGATIFVRPSSPNTRGYNLGMAYDISQTQGRDVSVVRLEDDTPNMERALATLMNYSPVPIEANHELKQPAYYDVMNMTIQVNPNYDDKSAFASIATEIALARLHNRGRNNYFVRDESLLDADSVSYLLCRRFGIERPLPDASKVAELNEGISVEGRSNVLNHVQDMAKQIGGSIDRHINPPQRAHNLSSRPER